MASYATVPAADLESEATLLNSKPKTKTSLLVGGVAAAAFVPPTPPQRPPRISKLQQIDNLRLNKRTVVKGLRRRRARRAGRRRKQRPVQA